MLVVLKLLLLVSLLSFFGVVSCVVVRVVVGGVVGAVGDVVFGCWSHWCFNVVVGGLLLGVLLLRLLLSGVL